MLSFPDILILCMPLAAAILAVMKDTFKEERPGGGKRITRFGLVAIILAVGGFVLGWYSTSLKKQEAIAAAVSEEEFRSHIKAALDEELPKAFSKLTEESQKQLNQSVSDTVDRSKRGLETAIDSATQKSGAEIQSAIQSSGRAVAADVSKSQERIKETLEITERKIDATIKGAQYGISEVVKQSHNDIRKSVTEAVDYSKKEITGVISQAVQDQTKKIGEMAEQTVGEQIMQIPLRIDQRKSGRLGGPLSGIIIKVGDVSKTKPFNITVYKETKKTKESGRVVLRSEEIKPLQENEDRAWHIITFTHPDTNKQYQLEVTVQTQTNRFGTGLDYVVVRAICVSCSS